MTVSELIAALSELPPDLPVMKWRDEGYNVYEDIESAGVSTGDSGEAIVALF